MAASRPPGSKLDAARQHIRRSIVLGRDAAQPYLDKGHAAPARELGRLLHVLECCGDEQEVGAVAVDVEAILARLHVVEPG